MNILLILALILLAFFAVLMAISIAGALFMMWLIVLAVGVGIVLLVVALQMFNEGDPTGMIAFMAIAAVVATLVWMYRASEENKDQFS